MSDRGDSFAEERFTAGYPGRILLLIALLSVTSRLGRLVISPLLPAIIDDLEITAARAGIALTLLTGLSAMSRYPGGRLADRLSRKTVIAASVGTWIVGFLVLAGATNYLFLLLGVTVVGIGLGMYTPAAFAQLSDLFERKQGRAFGVNNAALSLGGILSSGLAIAVIELGSWRLAFVPLIGVLVVLLLLVHRWVDQEYLLRRVDLEVRVTVERIAFGAQNRILLLVAALFAFVWNGAITFLPTFLEVERGLTQGAASLAFASVFATGLIATPLSGVVGDRVGSLHVVFAMLCFSIVGLGAVITAPSFAGVLTGVVLLAIGLTGFWPVMTASMMTAFPDANKGGDLGAMGTVYMAIGSIGPAYVGVVSDYVHYTGAYIGLLGLTVISILLIVWLQLHASSS